MVSTLTIIELIILGTIIVAAINIAIRYIFTKNVVHEACLKVGISPISSKDMLFVGLSALSLGYLTKGTLPDISEPLLYFSLSAPIAGLLNIFINKDYMRKYTSHIPFFGNYFTCPLATDEKVAQVKSEMRKNGISESEISSIQKCSFTCPNCRGTDAIKIVGCWSLANIFGPWIFKYFTFFS